MVLLHLNVDVQQILAVKGIPVKPLHQNPETGSVPLQNLNRSPPTVAERKHAARIGIEFEFQLDNCSKSVIAFS